MKELSPDKSENNVLPLLPPGRIGWECPRCLTIYSPDISSCVCNKLYSDTEVAVGGVIVDTGKDAVQSSEYPEWCDICRINYGLKTTKR